MKTASQLDLPSTLSSNTSKVGPAGSPASPAKEYTDLPLSTHNRSDADTLKDFHTEDGISDEECTDKSIKNISC